MPMNTQDSSFTFNMVEDKEDSFWSASYFEKILKAIGAAKVHIISQDEVDDVHFCYAQKPQCRDYHGPDHAMFVGQPDAPDSLVDGLSDNFATRSADFDEIKLANARKAKAILSVAGIFHDAAYKHIDAIDDQGTRAWPTALSKQISDVVRYKRTEENGTVIFRTFLTEEGKSDPLTQMVAHVFGMDTEKGIIHNQGGNEFDSAIAAARFLEKKGAPPSSILAVVSAIAATVPFKPALTKDKDGNIIDDGHMNELAHRVKTATLPTTVGEYNPSWEGVNDIMRLSVHLANRDISPFILPDNFANVVNGGRQIRNEELSVFRRNALNSNTSYTIYDVVAGATMESSSAFLYKCFSGATEGVPLHAENVPHVYFKRDEEGHILRENNGGIQESYPPLEAYYQAVENTRVNTTHATAFFRSHRAGAALAASLATLMGDPNPEVPGFVDARKWPENIAFKHNTPEDKAMYNALFHGQQQEYISQSVTKRSPIGGVIFGTLGMERMNALNAELEHIWGDASPQEALKNPQVAAQTKDAISNAIGKVTYATILNELRRVAIHYQDDPKRGNPDRVAFLDAELAKLKQQNRSLSTAHSR